MMIGLHRVVNEVGLVSSMENQPDLAAGLGLLCICSYLTWQAGILLNEN